MSVRPVLKEHGFSLAANHSQWIATIFAAGLLLLFAAKVSAQEPAATAASGKTASSAPVKDAVPADDKPNKPTRTSDKRRAAKLYLASSKLYESEKFEEAMRGFEQATKLDPTNADYPLAVEVARSHVVTALIQSAAKDRVRGDMVAARIALAHALDLDPKNAVVTQHLYELGDDALLQQPKTLYEQQADAPGGTMLGGAVQLAHAAGTRSFHQRIDQRVIIPQVFRAYGIEVTMDQSIQSRQIRFDMDDADFGQATRVVALLTHSFYVPLDAHRVLVQQDTRENRDLFTHLELETIYLTGLTAAEMTEVSTLAKNVFEIQQASLDLTAGTITVRAPQVALNAFNETLRSLLDGHSQVMLDVHLIQIGHTGQHNTGTVIQQQVTAFNAYSEEQSILNANQALVQQIVQSGLAAPGDTLAILGILLASGQVSSSVFSNGVALFGGGLTLSGISPGPANLKLTLNSSDTRELDALQLHLGDGEAGTIRSGSRYPIQTSSYSSGAANLPNIPGLTGAGNSSSLTSLLAQYASSIPNIPQVEYQDLGMTLKATPKVLRDDEVALTIDMKIDALAGSSLNGNPILNNRSYQGVVTLKAGQGVLVLSSLSKQESKAISGAPGISEIPGLNNVSDNNVQKDYSTLLIVMTPHVIRGTQAAGHTPMMRVEKSAPR